MRFAQSLVSRIIDDNKDVVAKPFYRLNFVLQWSSSDHTCADAEHSN
jgi:hypothetical protein